MTVERYNVAFMLGVNARRYGRDITRNPFAAADDRRTIWREGYEAEALAEQSRRSNIDLSA